MRSLAHLAAASLAVLGFAAGCVDRAEQAQARKTEELTKDRTILVRVQTPMRRDLAETIDVSGAIVAGDEAAVGPAVPGRLVSVAVKDGDRVSAGQTIARQETQTLAAQLRQAQAQAAAARSALDQARTDAATVPRRTAAAVRAAEARLAQARAQYEKALNGARDEERAQAETAVRRAKSDLDTAKASLDRANRLHTEGALALAELEAAQNRHANALSAYESALQAERLVADATRPEDLASAQQEVRAAEEALRIARADQSGDVLARDRVRSAQANLDAALQAVAIAQKALADATIRAPFAGRVSGRPLQPGTFVAPGAVVAVVVGGDGQYFEANVVESSVARVKPGAPVEVTLAALPEVTLTGRVAAVNPVASGPGRLFSVRIALTERIADVKAGMFARGRIEVGSRPRALVLPRDAVLRDGEDAYVYVVVGDKAERRRVRTGLETDGLVEVDGVAPRDQVVVVGQDGLSDGTPVRIEPGAQPKGSQGA